MDRAHGVIERSLEGVSEEQAKLCPEPGEWCIADVLRHVDEVDARDGAGHRTLAAGEKADISGMAPVIERGPETLAQLREGVARSFDELKSAVRAMPAGATLRRRSTRSSAT